MEWSTIALIGTAAATVLILGGLIIYYILYHMNTVIPSGGGGSPSGGCPNKSMIMVREVFFINVTLSGLNNEFMVCTSKQNNCLDTYNNNQTGWIPWESPLFIEFKTSFFRRNKSYVSPPIYNIQEQAGQGFCPPATSDGSYDPNNVWIQFISEAVDTPGYAHINQYVFPYCRLASQFINGWQFVQQSGYSYSPQVLPPMYTKGIDQLFNPMVRGNATYNFAHNPSGYTSYLPASMGRVSASIYPPDNTLVSLSKSSIVIPVYGYKPKQVFSKTPQRIYLTDSWNSTYTSGFDMEILPFNSQFWSYASVSQTGTRLTGQELLIFKLKNSDPNLVVAFVNGSIFKTKIPTVTWDQYQFSYAQGFNANNSEADAVTIYDYKGNAFIAWIDEDSSSSTYGINTKGDYFGTEDDNLKNTINMPNANETWGTAGYPYTVYMSVATPASTAVPLPPTTSVGGYVNPQYIYAFWGVKPDKSEGVKSLLASKWQASADSIELLPFNVTGNTQWSMYC